MHAPFQPRQAAEQYMSKMRAMKYEHGKEETEGDGRGGGIRTHDPSVPNAVRYQTALRPDLAMIIRDAGVFVKYLHSAQKLLNCEERQERKDFEIQTFAFFAFFAVKRPISDCQDAL
jgi:hypothetical protein